MKQNPLLLKINEFHPEQIDLDTIPEIKDFSISLSNGLAFQSENAGVITTFPWFDNTIEAIKDLPKDEIPGIKDTLWDELEQGWRVVIFKKSGFIVVLETPDPFGESIETYYKVRMDDYLNAWKKVMGAGYNLNKNNIWKGWWHY